MSKRNRKADTTRLPREQLDGGFHRCGEDYACDDCEGEIGPGAWCYVVDKGAHGLERGHTLCVDCALKTHDAAGQKIPGATARTRLWLVVSQRDGRKAFGLDKKSPTLERVTEEADRATTEAAG